MPASAPKQNKGISLDWFVQGVLTKLGNTLDKFAGRSWKPSSSLATSELIERLKILIDKEAREGDSNKRYVPHNIKLKMQWDKFSTDSEAALKTLEVELLTALVDHINDRRYYTYAPISLEVKPDYFTTGVKLFASFDQPNEADQEASLDVTVPSLTVNLPDEEPAQTMGGGWNLSFRFEIGGRPWSRSVDLKPGDRLSVGRTKENDFAIDDPSVSKLHASLRINADGQLVVADTGSTNGTFIGGRRIEYGKAAIIAAGQTVRFGSVDVIVGIEVIAHASDADQNPQASEFNGQASYEVDGFEFMSRQPAADHETHEAKKLNESSSIGATTMILTPLPAETKKTGEKETVALDGPNTREEP